MRRPLPAASFARDRYQAPTVVGGDRASIGEGGRKSLGRAWSGLTSRIDLLSGRMGSHLLPLNSGNHRSILGLLQLFRLRSFDQATVEGRSRERYRRVLLTAASSLTAKGITALTMLVSVPLTVSYLGTERYGLWMTLSSLIALFSFADLGIGNGLVNSLAEAHGRGDRAAAVGVVSSAFVLLVGVAVVLLATFALIHTCTPWALLFRVWWTGRLHSAWISLPGRPRACGAGGQ